MGTNCLRFAAVAILAATAGRLSSAEVPPAPRADAGQDLVVHEWGTFTSFSGSDGALLRFRPANTDLPRFVYRGGPVRKDELDGTVSLETPVLYFYAARPLT